MKNLKIIGLFAIAILIVGAMLYFMENSTSWQTYTNARYAFSVDYPADWSLGEAPTNNDGREFFSPDDTLSCNAYGFPNALTGASGDPQTLDEFVDWLEENMGVDDILGRNRTKMAGQAATEIVMASGGTVSQAVYILGEETGYGLACYYPGVDAKDAFKTTFDHMRQSFSLSDASSAALGTEQCENLLLGAVTPLQDLQTFSDTEYTEVTMTSREYWNRNMLPTQVPNLESRGYDCYPMPGAFGDSDGSAQPEVTRVDWSCELEYDDWKYVDTDADKRSAEQAGYTCVTESCTKADNTMSGVWRCTK